MVFSTTSGPAIDWLLPTARNLNLLPVKANGLVRFRSPACLGSGGSVSTPTSRVPPAFEDVALPFSNCSNTSDSCSPRKIEIIAGGASLASRRWSLPLVATATRSRLLYLCTARITAAQNTRNWAFSCGLSPGSSRLPRLQPSDQLTCLPEPLMPANGFSCSRQTMPYFCATRVKVCMIIC